MPVIMASVERRVKFPRQHDSPRVYRHICPPTPHTSVKGDERWRGDYCDNYAKNNFHLTRPLSRGDDDYLYKPQNQIRIRQKFQIRLNPDPQHKFVPQRWYWWGKLECEHSAKCLASKSHSKHKIQTLLLINFLSLPSNRVTSSCFVHKTFFFSKTCEVNPQWKL